jgi:anaerobic selenocysteine-containing dehydrogenase
MLTGATHGGDNSGDTESKSLFQGREGRVMFCLPQDIRSREPPVKRKRKCKREPSFRGFVMSTKLIASLCPYCAVGCGLYLEVDKGIAKGIEYMTDHPACEGALCPKGNALLEILNHEERLKYPLKKVGDGFVRIPWDEALDLVAQGLSRNLRKHGPKSLGFLASSRCNNEENYLMQKMARLMWTTAPGSAILRP